MAVGERCIYQKLSASGVVNTSGAPIVLYGISTQSGTDGASVVSVYDGTSTGGTLTRTVNGNTNDWYNENFHPGRVYPNGLFLNLDTNTVSVVVWYQVYP